MENKYLYDENFKFEKDVETVFDSINKAFNMDRILLNYVEVNEFKLAIKEGLERIDK